MSQSNANSSPFQSTTEQESTRKFSPSPEVLAEIDASLPEKLQALRHEDLSATIPPALLASDFSELVLLFIRKLRVCSHFVSIQTEPAKVPAQMSHLHDLASVATSAAGHGIPIFELSSLYPDIIAFASGNIFRSMRRPTYDSQGGFYDPEEDDQTPDPDWPRLLPVYEVLFSWIQAPGLVTKAAKHVLTHRFLGQFISLFDSEDPRERDYCKNILHRIYGRFPSHRIFIRTRIYDVLATYVQETQRHNGIRDLLDLLGPIINGFNVPIKDEHIKILLHVLMPLHAAPHLAVYYRNLSYCVQQYVIKEPTLAPAILRLLIRFWPQTSAAKTVYFLDELQVVLRYIPITLFDADLAALVMRCIGAGCISSHFHVNERALHMLECPETVHLLLQQHDTMYDVLVAALTATARGHWCQETLSSNTKALRMLQSLDPDAFNNAIARLPDRRRAELMARHEAKERYTELRLLAYANAQGNVGRLRILARVDSYICPSQPSDVGGLGLFGKPVIGMPALEDTSLSKSSMKTHVDALALDQVTLVGADRRPTTRTTVRGGQVAEPRYDVSLMSELDRPLRGGIGGRQRVEYCAERRVAFVLRLSGYRYNVPAHFAQLAPSLACRGKPTLSTYEWSSRIINEAAATGLVPLSAPVDPIVLSKNSGVIERLFMKTGLSQTSPLSSRKPSASTPSAAPSEVFSTGAASIRDLSLAQLADALQNGQLSPEQASEIVSRVDKAALHVSTKRSFSIQSPDHPPPNENWEDLAIDIPDLTDGDESSASS